VLFFYAKFEKCTVPSSAILIWVGEGMQVDVGMIVGLGGLFIAAMGYLLNKTNTHKKEASESASHTAKMQADVSYIRSSIDEMKIESKATEKLVLSHGERITRLEESQKSMHKRLDMVEVNKYEN
jgi:hypothetical protein